jgi:hypothetical protein
MSTIPTEQYTRKRLMAYAELIGAKEDLEQLFIKWDSVMAIAPENEREPMAQMAILEVEKLLDCYSSLGNGLTVNGKTIIKGKEKKDGSKK